MTFTAPPGDVSILLIPTDNSGALVLVTAQTYDPRSKTLTAQPPAPLKPHTTYRLSITAVGRNTTAAAPTVRTTTFTTGA